MLTYCRPHGSAAEQEFIQAFIQPLPGAYKDIFGNWHVRVEDAPVLWSCHTDTVHWREGRQDVKIKRGHIVLASPKKAARTTTDAKGHKYMWAERDCLGADDAAGVFIMTEMIQAGVPGRYVFHFGEEVGGLGSSDLARCYADWLMECQYAIAFDRRGTTDVITHQGRGRCASDTFALALAKLLNTGNKTFRYAPSNLGVYTDTAEYMGLIPECTNISVGYAHEHTEHESVNVQHILALVEVMKRIDVSALPVERDPLNDDDDFFDYTSPVANSWSLRTGKPKKSAKRRRNDYPAVVDRYNSAYLDPEWEEIQREIEIIIKNGNRTGVN